MYVSRNLLWKFNLIIICVYRTLGTNIELVFSKIILNFNQ